MTDVMARFHQMDGHDVFFLTGTDEHGQKVERTAEKENMSPQDFVNEKSMKFRTLVDKLQCVNNDFIRTTEERHSRKVIELWNELVKRDMIYLGHYEGWYSVVDETFYSSRELVNGVAPTGADVEWVKEESYFFRLSKFTDKLIKHYENNPNFVVPSSRQKDMINLITSNEGGLEDISISRTSFSWGIRVPSRPEHVVYVWLDALINYMSAIDATISSKELTGQHCKYWPPDVHVVGKDILYFHSVLWPALLMAVGQDLPRRIVAHGW